MPEDFEWYTEESSDWEVAAAAPASRSPQNSRWLMLLAIFCLVAAVGWIVYHRVKEYANAAAASSKTDILASHNLVRQAARQRDAELFETVLSGRDPRWTGAQKALAADGLLFDRSLFGFKAASAAADFATTKTGDVSVTLSADLRAAELTWLEPFVVYGGEAITETVRLAQTAVYRQGARSWLLSPPERDFWGNREEVSGAYTTLVYPERDGKVARRLVHDIDAVIVGVCTRLDGIVCPAGLSLRLRLETGAGSLLAAHDGETMLTSGRNLTLPAPTLVGLPVDEAGYQALVRGYAALVVPALITDLVGYECCVHGLFYRALLDKQLSQLGLRPWPLTETGYEQLLSNPGALPGVGSLWAARPPLDLPVAAEWMPVYSLADFLLTEWTPGMDVAEIQRALGWRSVFADWFTRLTGVPYDADTFSAAWLEFIYRHSASARMDLPISLPEQRVGLVCSQRNQGVWLHRYDWDTGNWRQEFGREYESEPASGYVYPLPGASRIVLQEAFFPNAQGEVRLSVWQDGHEIFTLDQSPGVTDSTYPFYFDGADSTGRYLILRKLDQRRDARYQLLDLASCGEGSCERRSLPGRPLWSPDGARTLLAGEPPVVTAAAGAEWDPWLAPLFRGDARGQLVVSLGAGLEPFWLDRETYGYLRRTGDDVELVTAVVNDDRPYVVLRAIDLLSPMAPTVRPNVTLDRMISNPADSRQVLVVARTIGEERSYVLTFFLLELTADLRGIAAIQQLFQTERPAEVSGFSPDGRWLVVSTWNANERDYTIDLIDLQSNERQTFNGSGSRMLWSVDGQWLVQPEGDYVLLRAPAYGYKRLMLHNFSNCYSAYWAIGD